MGRDFLEAIIIARILFGFFATLIKGAWKFCKYLYNGILEIVQNPGGQFTEVQKGNKAEPDYYRNMTE